ncbi:MAG: 2-amino-4-hydroxy-6-hydroxymethyldihydropteridine diphosphokinase [Terracidiphilus sp.]|nr:2-amino-4-hydroxy-6-hydroxymethyldihydropteridine diphosphokinase [Terracidiphilus sp.]
MRTAYIGMGANLDSHTGSPAETLAAAAERLAALGRVTRRSTLYSTAPVGFADQPRFTNAVVALETVLSPAALLQELLAIEKEFGRDRAASFTNGPRTLDLDLLLLGDLNLHEADLDIPHPRLAERAFVLVPLAEIAPSVRVPGQDASVAELLERLRLHSPDDVHSVVAIEAPAWQTSKIVE